mgnify:FL=1
MFIQFLRSITSEVPFIPYVSLFVATLVEGPIATLAGGSLSATGIMHPAGVYFSVVSANLAADLGWYGLGRFGQMNWLEKAASRLGIQVSKVFTLTQGIQKQAPKLLFLTKFSTGFPIPTLIATGLGKVPMRKWLWASVAGELIKSALLVAAGFAFSKTLRQTSETVQILAWTITILLCCAGIVWSILKHKSPKVR